MDPITQFLTALAAQIVRAIMAELIADLPLLVTQLRQIGTSTAVTAPAATPAEVDAANAAARNAIAAGKMPPI